MASVMAGNINGMDLNPNGEFLCNNGANAYNLN